MTKLTPARMVTSCSGRHYTPGVGSAGGGGGPPPAARKPVGMIPARSKSMIYSFTQHLTSSPATDTSPWRVQRQAGLGRRSCSEDVGQRRFSSPLGPLLPPPSSVMCASVYPLNRCSGRPSARRALHERWNHSDRGRGCGMCPCEADSTSALHYDVSGAV